MTDPIKTCPTCQTPMALYCPDGCGLATPVPVCPKCNPDGVQKHQTMRGQMICEDYWKAKQKD